MGTPPGGLKKHAQLRRQLQAQLEQSRAELQRLKRDLDQRSEQVVKTLGFSGSLWEGVGCGGVGFSKVSRELVVRWSCGGDLDEWKRSWWDSAFGCSACGHRSPLDRNVVKICRCAWGKEKMGKVYFWMLFECFWLLNRFYGHLPCWDFCVYSDETDSWPSKLTSTPRLYLPFQSWSFAFWCGFYIDFKWTKRTQGPLPRPLRLPLLLRMPLASWKSIRKQGSCDCQSHRQQQNQSEQRLQRERGRFAVVSRLEAWKLSVW